MKSYYTTADPYFIPEGSELRIAKHVKDKYSDINHAQKITIKKWLIETDYGTEEFIPVESFDTPSHLCYEDIGGKEHTIDINDFHDTHWYYIVKL